MAGLTPTLPSAAGNGLIVRTNVALRLKYPAVNVTPVEALTLLAVTVKVTEVAPAGTVTLAGTVAAAVFELETDTTAPPAGAAEVRLTVPVPFWLLLIALGETEILLSAAGGGLTVRPKVSLEPPNEAVSVTGVGVVTLPAVTGKVVEVAPCGTVTVGEMLTSAGDELRLMVAPPLPGAVVSATEQVDPADGLIEIGLQVKPFKLGVCRMVTVPLLVNVDNGVPVALADVPFMSWTEEEVSWVDEDKVRVTVAMTAFVIVVSFRPHKRHMAVPVAYSQEIDLFATAGPAASATEEKSVVE